MSPSANYPATLDLEPWPGGFFQFETPLPGSKSLTLRDCAIAALADGVSTIRFPGEADDYWRMKDCLRRLGLAVDDSHEGEAKITGQGGGFATGRVALDVGQSAVTARLMLAFAALRPDETLVDGHISMQKRPNKDLVTALAALGAQLDSSNDGFLPTTVRGSLALRGPVKVPGNISSQYLTSLMIIAPLIQGGLTIEVQGDLTSKPYVDLTLDEMAKFGVQVDNQDYRRTLGPQQAYRAGTIDVAGDASAASYFAAGHVAWRSDHVEQSWQRHSSGRLRFFHAVRTTRRQGDARRRAHAHRGSRRARPAFRRARRHDQHAGRRTYLDDDRAVSRAADAYHRARHVASQGMRPHRRAHARTSQAGRNRGRGA